MPTTVDGALGVSKIQDGTVSTAKVVDGAITPAKLSGGQTGSAPAYGIRAWLVIDGTVAGSGGLLASGNVASVTRNGVGSYTVVFATPMPDVNYAIAPCCQPGDTNSYSVNMQQGVGRATTGFTFRVTSQSATLTDLTYIAIMVVR